jgi:hypothetical protein
MIENNSFNQHIPTHSTINDQTGFFFLFLNNFYFLNSFKGENVLSDMEKIINIHKEEESSENICDVPSTLRKQVTPSYSSLSFVLPHHHHQQEEQQISFKGKRRSTINCSSSKQENSYLLNLNENKNSLSKSTSHQSIDIIKENDFNHHHSSIENKLLTTTQIKLSLPVITTNGLNPRRRFLNKSEQGEFTLPTNPPITVTIQPQRNLIHKNNSLHDDHICSPEHIHLINQQRISLDPSLKGTSTIVNYFMDLLKPSDNKLAMKLFGSKKGVLKERLRQQRAGHCIIHPCSNFR